MSLVSSVSLGSKEGSAVLGEGRTGRAGEEYQVGTSAAPIEQEAGNSEPWVPNTWVVTPLPSPYQVCYQHGRLGMFSPLQYDDLRKGSPPEPCYQAPCSL